MSAALESLFRAVPEQPTRAGLVEFSTFLAIGGGAALAFVMLSQAMFGLHSGIADWIVSALCYAAFIGPVYLLHRRFSFSSNAAHAVALPRYLSTQASALLLATIFSFLLYGVFGLPSLPASLLVLVLTSAVNFVVLRRWAFARTA